MTHWRTDLENVPEYPAEFLVWHKGPNGYASVTVKGSGEFDYDEEPTITHWAVISTPIDGGSEHG